MRLGNYVAKMYQFGYVTRDIDRAVAHFKEKMGIGEFFRLTTDSQADYRGGVAPFRLHVALANLGDKQIELIQPIEGVNDFYAEGLDLERSVAVLHHYAAMVEGPESNWEVMKGVLRDSGYPIVLSDHAAPGEARQIHFAYADTRADFGHYLEFIWLSPQSRAWHDSLPNFG